MKPLGPEDPLGPVLGIWCGVFAGLLLWCAAVTLALIVLG